MLQDIIDLDTLEKVRYVSESSNASTSGYSTMSPGPSGFNSTPPSPSQSPSATLPAEFSNLNLPSGVSLTNQTLQQNYTTLQPVTSNYNGQAFLNYSTMTIPSSAMVTLPQQQQQQPITQQFTMPGMYPTQVPSVYKKPEYTAKLHILEQPVEKFRFRYKSEMHGTHGSLNGANSKRTPKTFPEVELRNFSGHAVIRCSLYQTNLDSPHSHQLVVRKDDRDICDPHDLHVTQDRGYIAQFQNMGIIHTAKKFISEELLKKKTDRMRFELGGDELSTKQKQELYKEAQKEAKEMNLNQVRLCFEAFKVEDNNSWTRIAAPVYSNSINNRKSAQTGELRICRLSIAAGSVAGGDDLILLVEKVSKKNIKVRFFEMTEDDGVTWEAYGKFRESDVHHQYAIVCQTPPYKSKEIDKPVEIYIELVRPSDDERSFPPLIFRYKPLDVVSRKRRRTCSSATSSSGSGSSLSSEELPKPVQDQTAFVNNRDAQTHQQQINISVGSMEFNKEEELHKILGSGAFRECINKNSEELFKMVLPNSMTDFHSMMTDDCLQTDGAASIAFSAQSKNLSGEYKRSAFKFGAFPTVNAPDTRDPYLQRIFKIFGEMRVDKGDSTDVMKRVGQQISDIFDEHAGKNDETLIHDIIAGDNYKTAIKVFNIIVQLKLNDLLNRLSKTQGETGLHCACLLDRMMYVRPLLGLGCDPNIQNRNGNTALHIAVKEQHQKCIDAFLNMKDLKLDLTIKNDEGLTALHQAIRLSSDDVAKKLLKHNSNAALVCNPKDGNNALHMAVLQQNVELVQAVLEKQNVYEILRTRNAAGHTALDIAKSLNTKNSKMISDYLSSLSSNNSIGDDDDEPRLVIKEEEVSSSSSDDENEPAEDEQQVQTEALELVIVKEEKMECDDGAATSAKKTAIETADRAINLKLTKQTLDDILGVSDKFNQLAKRLNQNGKWKALAEACKMQHLLCLWSNAEDLLQYVRKKANSINYAEFAVALGNVDGEALRALQTT